MGQETMSLSKLCCKESQEMGTHRVGGRGRAKPRSKLGLSSPKAGPLTTLCHTNSTEPKQPQITMSRES